MMLMLCQILIGGIAVCEPAPVHHTHHYAPKPVVHTQQVVEIQRPFPGNGIVCGGAAWQVNRDLCDFQASGAGRY